MNSMTCTLAAAITCLRRIAPLELAESWDRVGLLVEGDGRAIARVLLAIDVTPAVLEEAQSIRADLIVGYHPLLFKPLERLDGATWQGRVALNAVRAGIAIYSPHTALDAVEGGINDWLVEIMGDGRATEVAALQPSNRFGGNTHRIVAFVPESAVDEVRTALAEADAGRIGAYSHCSFTTRGEGTFFGHSGTQPTVGRAGHLERVQEIRLEMAFHKRNLRAVVAALHAAHPYEEPAFDLLALDPIPAAPRVGAGRIASFETPATVEDIARKLEQQLACGRIERTRGSVGPSPASRHRKFAVCAGSGASLLDVAAAQGASLFLTGEMSHHDVLRAHALGLEILLAGHTNTERGYLPRLATAMESSGLSVLISTADRDPLVR